VPPRPVPATCCITHRACGGRRGVVRRQWAWLVITPATRRDSQGSMRVLFPPIRWCWALRPAGDHGLGRGPSVAPARAAAGQWGSGSGTGGWLAGWRASGCCLLGPIGGSGLAGAWLAGPQRVRRRLGVGGCSRAAAPAEINTFNPFELGLAGGSVHKAATVGGNHPPPGPLGHYDGSQSFDAVWLPRQAAGDAGWLEPEPLPRQRPTGGVTPASGCRPCGCGAGSAWPGPPQR